MTTATRTRPAVEQEHYPADTANVTVCATDNQPWPCPTERERRKVELGRFLADASRRSAEFEAALPHVAFERSVSLAKDVAPLLRLIDDLDRRIREAFGVTSRVDPFDSGLTAVQLAEIRAILTGGNQ